MKDSGERDGSTRKRLVRSSIVGFGAALVAASLAACWADAPRDEVEHTGQPLASHSVCNMGASAAPLRIGLSEQLVGTFPSSATVPYQLVNATSEWMTIRVDMRSDGLDSREAVRMAWQGDLAPGASASQTFRLDQLPLQSTHGKGVTRLIATIVRAPNQEHLEGMRNVSGPLAAVFSPSYSSVVLSGDDTWPPAVLENPQNPDQLANQLAPLILELRNYQGRIWNGTAWSDASSLPPQGDKTVPPGRTIALRGADARFMDFGPPLNGPIVNQGGIRVCALHKQDYLDDGRGEEIIADAAPASFLEASLFEAYADGSVNFGKQIWRGHLDRDGCTPTLSLVVGHPHALATATAALAPAGGKFIARDAGGVAAVEFSYFGVSKLPLVGPAATVTLRSLGVRDDYRAATIAIVSRVFASPYIAVPVVSAGNFEAKFGYCGGRAKGQPYAYTACGIDNTVWLGPNEDGTHNTQWKFVVAHEIGHLIQWQQRAAVWPDYSAEESPDSGLPPACNCKHIADSNEQSHCISSREYLSGVENEGFAHGVAAATFSGSASANCKFVYYKEVRVANTPLIRRPPVALDCAGQIRYMESNCVGADRGVEWDWMNWQRAMALANISTNDFGAIYAGACGGAGCNAQGVPAPTVPSLRASASSFYGSDPRAITFRDLANLYGVAH